MTAVSYTLLINGTPPTASLLNAVHRIEVEEHVDLASMLRLRLNIGVAESGDQWRIIDEKIFERLTPLSLRVTLGSGIPQTLIKAHVIETNIDFSSEPGQSTLNVVAMDETIRMNLEEKIRAWPNMADSTIATTLFDEYGLVPVVESTQPVRQVVDQTVVQHGTDIEFLRFLAHRNGYECYVETNPLTQLEEGHFHPPRLEQQPQGTLNVNLGESTNVDNLNVRFDKVKPATAETADLKIGSQSQQSANVSEIAHRLLGSDSPLGDGNQRRHRLSKIGLAETGELQTYAQAVVDRSAWAITAAGMVYTNTYGDLLRARRLVLVRGVGRQFSGMYYVERVQHLIENDQYSQHFTLRRNATGLTGGEPFGQV
jgi:phage protein D